MHKWPGLGSDPAVPAAVGLVPPPEPDARRPAADDPAAQFCSNVGLDLVHPGINESPFGVSRLQAEVP
jgi:hypothetical protein